MVMREVFSLIKLQNHRNITRYRGISSHEGKLIIVMDPVYGINLRSFVNEYPRCGPGGGLKEASARYFFMAIVTAVAYCHTKVSMECCI